MHVKCANCNMVYDKNKNTKACTRCESNASVPVQQASPPKQTEGTQTGNRRLLLDDMPGKGKQLNG